ncbi:hypothetical protein BH20VER2_BH20VER2_19340 [soil metagenome]
MRKRECAAAQAGARASRLANLGTKKTAGETPAGRTAGTAVLRTLALEFGEVTDKRAAMLLLVAE